MSDVSVIALGHKVTGTVSAAEDLVIQGRVEGRIQSEATVIVDTQAIVEAEILARHVLIKGIVIGDVSGVEGIEVAPSGQVLGDLRTRRLALRAGGRVLGVVQSGVEVQPYAMAGKSAGAAAWQRGTARPARSYSEEVVETSRPAFPAPATAASAAPADVKKAKKEPSREAH